jgi:DNA-binding response OmpR family regulator
MSLLTLCKRSQPDTEENFVGDTNSLKLQKLQILFVDKDAYAQERVLQALENGFQVQCATSVTEAKDCLNTSLPDIVISEVLLGQENGLDLCRYVRARSFMQHVPVMLLTSMTTLQDKVAGFAAGADDYVVKPFDTYHLMARIRLLTRIKHLEQRTSM